MKTGVQATVHNLPWCSTNIYLRKCLFIDMTQIKIKYKKNLKFLAVKGRRLNICQSFLRPRLESPECSGLSNRQKERWGCNCTVKFLSTLSEMYSMEKLAGFLRTRRSSTWLECGHIYSRNGHINLYTIPAFNEDTEKQDDIRVKYQLLKMFLSLSYKGVIITIHFGTRKL